MPYASTSDVDIYYAERGPAGAQPLLFCHGAGGNGTSWWQQMGAFADTYRCIAMDHRGFGRSRCAPEQFGVEAFAADALAVLDAAGIEAAHVVCQSMGGWTGVRLALEQPSRVASLVLSDTIGGLALASGIESARGMKERADQAGAVTPALAADYPRRDPAGAFLYLELSAFNSDLEDLGLFRHLFAEASLLPVSRAVELALPVLVVAGEDDLIWPPAVLEELAGHFPDGRFVRVPAGHSPYFESPAAFNAALAGFLEDIA